MFGFGSFSHILVVLVLALILIGPKQLPEVARTLGRLLSELRRASNGFQDQINAQMRELDQPNVLHPDEEQQIQQSRRHYEDSSGLQNSSQSEQLELQPQNTTRPETSTAAVQPESENKSDEKKS